MFITLLNLRRTFKINRFSRTQGHMSIHSKFTRIIIIISLLFLRRRYPQINQLRTTLLKTLFPSNSLLAIICKFFLDLYPIEIIKTFVLKKRKFTWNNESFLFEIWMVIQQLFVIFWFDRKCCTCCGILCF